MAQTHTHDHAHGHDHDHDDAHGGLFGHHHHHDHGGDGPMDGAARLRFILRMAMAAVILAGAGLASCAVMVAAGEAIVVTAFGDPVRVLTEPGLAWKLPAPVEGTIPVDLRLRTTSTGLQDVGTRDGLRVLVQAYISWRVPPEAGTVRQFVRSVRNDPDEAARQLRSLVGSALQVTASNYDLTDLVNTDPAQVRLADFESLLLAQIAPAVRQSYGIAITQVGIERLSLPEATLSATVGRMRSERETVAAQRTAEGLRAAAQVRSEAARDSRIIVAEARAQAAEVEASSRKEAAAINARAYGADPSLYLLLRSLDTLSTVVGANTRLILRTDAAPFSVLVDGTQVRAADPPPAAGTPARIGASHADAGPAR